MAIQPGTHLGPYEIVSAIGAGGMGEVYRARDPKLGRDVAIKVLPEAFARDSARMERFRREAKILASLNHTNIASIYGLEDSDTTHALVMELAEGPTLADRLKQGPIPIDEALPIARQIADALEYAHEKSVIHRDLKPANIKVAADDTVKILDFGLAKALEDDPSSIDISTSPTISRMATMQGVLLGTAAYMSPEQAKAKSVDRRADIWAFGCVLYEMLTGKQAFTGETVTESLAAVIMKDPDWSQLPPKTPMRFRVLLQRCLQRDVRQRLQAMGDARISLDEVLSGAPEGASTIGVSSTEGTKGGWRQVVLWSSIAALVVGATVGLAVWNLKPSPAKPVTRFTIMLPPGLHLVGLGEPALALSPDGTKLAYVAMTQGGSAPQIYVRAMNTMETRSIPGTEGATDPFFSPDSQSLGFFADGHLKKISVNGGAALTLADAPTNYGASWGSQGMIVFAPDLTGFQQVAEGGGAPQPLTHLEKGDVTHTAPKFLPSGKAVLFNYGLPGGVAVETLGTGERRNLIQGGSSPSYAVGAQEARGTQPSASTQVEEIYVVRTVPESRTAPTAFCAQDRIGFAGATYEGRWSLRSTATQASDGRMIDTNVKTVGSIHTCNGPTADPSVLNDSGEGVLGSMAFKEVGECHFVTRDFPEQGIGTYSCFLRLSGLPSGYVGGLLTTNSIVLASQKPGPESDPPGYTRQSIATIRLWRKRDAPSSAMAQTKYSLVGTWKLVSFKVPNDKGELEDRFGPNPTGFLTYTADGRVSVIMANSRRKPFTSWPPPAEDATATFLTFASYAGTYAFSGDKVTHHIEVSLIQALVNTDQVRSVKLEGDRLTLRGGGLLGGGVTELVWERLKPESTDK
jgi:aminoglycoside phosphotransferase (APT) family kinase protein